jgi:hypothetical protein
VAKLPDLYSQARDFAGLIQELLNRTVCNGANISASMDRGEPRVIIAPGLSQADPLVGSFLPLTIDRKRPRAWIALQYRCFLGKDGYLTVDSSFCGVYADEDGRACMCHYDYERDKPTYPEAHFQVHGTSEALTTMTQASRRKATELDRLHFPVGGRRYRPCLEDILEFLIVEGFVRGREGWKPVLDEHRDRFLEIQLKAAVRRHPDVARSILDEIGQ